MLHNVETLIDDLLGSLPEVPNIEAMQKAEDAAAAASRPKWDAGEMLDIDELMRETTYEGELEFSKLSRGPIQSHEVAESEIHKIAEDALRRMAGGNDDLHRRDDDVEDEADPDEQEPPEDRELHEDMQHLRAAQSRGEDLHEMRNALLKTNFPLAKRYGRAIAWLGAA